MAGYNGYSKSNNAVAAENAGYVVRTKITKAWLTEGGIDESPAFIKWLAAKELIAADEWHHTSIYYNETNYYSTAGISAGLADLAKYKNLEQVRRIYANKDARKLDGHTIDALASYLANPRFYISEFFTAKLAKMVEDFGF